MLRAVFLPHFHERAYGRAPHDKITLVMHDHRNLKRFGVLQRDAVTFAAEFVYSA